MGKRTIYVDPNNARREQYRKFDNDALSALWEVVELLSDNGIDIGPKATEVLVKRQKIKENCPQNTNNLS